MKSIFKILSLILITISMGTSKANAVTQFDYNLFVLGDFNGYYSDVEGRVAVQGNATLNGYSIGAKAPAGNSLVVGGNLTVGSSGGSTNGATVVGGSVTTPSWGGYSSTSTTAYAAMPIDFAAESERLTWLTGALKDYTTNGTTSAMWGQLFFSGTDPTLNVFSVTADQLAASNTFHINVTPGSQVLFNVSGTNVSMQNAGFDLQGVDASSILYNFYDATSLSFSSIGLQGSVLATGAAYNGGWGNVNGQMIVASFNAPTQINNNPYSGTLLDLAPPASTPSPPSAPDGGEPVGGTPGAPESPVAAVPELSTWAQMILGFGILGLALRQRRIVAPARPATAMA
jgi:choice-of-anchor A domain-containing protein